jgi:hypothetical protein
MGHQTNECLVIDYLNNNIWMISHATPHVSFSPPVKAKKFGKCESNVFLVQI